MMRKGFVVTFLSGVALLASPVIHAESASEKIDELVAKQLSEQGVKANALVSDSTFVRRAYLDIVGRIPTMSEAKTYIESDTPGKREELVDELLASEGYVNHYFNFWADILRVNRTANNSGLVTPYYSEFIKEFLRGKPAL